jgi:pimeloyl-ACP methyl ester carboxylesterase
MQPEAATPLEPPIREIDLDGPVAYREWDGPKDATFVLVHGLGGSHVNWVRVAPGLAGLGRVLAPDLPGSGYSRREGRDTGVMSLRRTLSRFVSEKATGRVIVCGNSMGGAIGMLQAAIEPDAQAGLVLTCSTFPWVRGGWPHPLVMAMFSMYRTPGVGEQLVTTRLRRMDPEQLVRIGFRFAAADPRSIPEDVVRLHVEMARERQGDPEVVAAFLDAARSLLRLGARPDVAHRAMDAIRCSVLVLHGRRDRLVPAGFAEAALRRYPQWRGRIFPDLGHVPMLEAPGRWLAEVADWHAEVIR